MLALSGLALSGCSLTGAPTSCDDIVATVQQGLAAAPNPADALRDGDYAAVAASADALADGLQNAADGVGDVVIKAGISGLAVAARQIGPVVEGFAASGNADAIADVIDQHLTPEAVEGAIRTVCTG